MPVQLSDTLVNFPPWSPHEIRFEGDGSSVSLNREGIGAVECRLGRLGLHPGVCQQIQYLLLQQQRLWKQEVVLRRCPGSSKRRERAMEWWCSSCWRYVDDMGDSHDYVSQSHFVIICFGLQPFLDSSFYTSDASSFNIYRLLGHSHSFFPISLRLQFWTDKDIISDG